MPIIREAVLKQHPEIAQWLKPVSAALGTETLRQLNASITVEGQNASKVAADFLKQKGGFIPS